MAILSNINGKFAVESSGAIQLSGSAGTSGYVLKSNGTGNAASWVDPTTIIGGPYLPLSGGTLTGATATANNISFTVGGQFNINGTGNWSFRSTSVSGNLILKDESNNADRVDFHPDGQVEILAAGSRFYPSIIFNNDINTGIYHAAADTLGFSGGGNELMTLNYSNGVKLSQYGSGSYTGTTAYTLAVDSSGNIIETTDGGGDVTGSGTTNTVAKFTGAKAIGNGPITFSGNNSTFSGKIVASNGVQFTGGSIATATAVLHTNNIIYFRGGSNGLFLQNADGSDGMYVANDHIKFDTSSTERMRIDSGGDVLIGNTVVNPASGFSNQRGFGYDNSTGNLQIASTSGNAFVVGRNEASDGTIIELRKESNVVGTLGSNTTSGQMLLDIIGSSSNGNIRFVTNGAEVMRMTSAYNVGVGTSNPQNKFVVKEGSNVDMEFGSESSGCFIQTYNRTSNTWGYLRFIAGGGERMRITQAGGEVLINQTSDLTGQIFQVNGMIDQTDVTKALRVYNGSTFVGGIGSGQWAFSSSYATDYSLYAQNNLLFHAGTGSSIDMMINGSHNVGIGTTSPNNKLEISDTGAGTGSTHLKISRGADSSAVQRIAGIKMGNTASNDGSNWIIQADSSSGYFDNADLDFIHNSAGTPSTRMTLTSAGKLGVGTASPQAALHVKGTTTTSGGEMVRIQGAYATGRNYLQFADSGGNIDAYIGLGSSSDDRFLIVNFTDSPTYFYNKNSIKMTITNVGNVGIATTSPNEKLTVAGNVNIQGTGALLRWNSGDMQIRNAGSYAMAFDTYSGSALVERMRIVSGGYIGMNTSPSGFATLEIENIASTTYGLYVDYIDTNASYGAMKVILTGASTSPSYVDWWYGATQTGAVVTTGSSTQYLTSSDYRLKENIVPMSNAIDRVMQLKPSRFNFIGHENIVDGLIAHEVAEVVPEAVNGEKDGLRDDGTPKYQGIDEGKLVPLLIGAIQELEARVKELENK